MDFLKQFLRAPGVTGAVAPSSGRLARLITDTACLADRKCVVELGPGTGVFTREILKKIPSGCVFFCLEVNPYFAGITRKNCPGATVYETSAERLGSCVSSHNRKSCDCIISGLPWAAFGHAQQERLLEEIYRCLEKGGEFLTFAYIQGLLLPSGIRFRKLLTATFARVGRTGIVWRNLPPAFVYHCIK
jgi:phosphatidylethanolamine/phosphatidyl-N-methylethanolamine N-methyltransferase